MRTTNLAASNFLVPNGTFIVELIAFLMVLGVLAKWVIPRINKAMTGRQEAIKHEFAELEQAKADARAAEEKYRSQMSDARHEAARIREKAREEGAAIVAEMREQARGESERIIKNAHQQIEAERQQVIQQLRTELGSMATTLAARIVGESLDDDERRSRTVERFIASLEQGEPSEVG
jgi:F-type H+-transporting ATPase subunit b